MSWRAENYPILYYSHDHRVITSLQKRAVFLYPERILEAKYMNILTPYAYGYVKQQLQLAAQVKHIHRKDPYANKFEVDALSG